MAEDVKGATARRPNRREVAAAETRREILRTARRLFAEHGFTGTSVQQIAEEAGVAVQTIYSSVGSKSALILALGDLIEEEADAPRLNAEISRQTDPRQLIATGVHLTRQLNERCGDILQVLVTAASADPDAAALAAQGMHRHDHGASQAARRLAALGVLAPALTSERAAAVFAMMTSPASWRQLTQRSGWSFDEAETWLTASLIRLLLESSRGVLGLIRELRQCRCCSSRRRREARRGLSRAPPDVGIGRFGGVPKARRMARRPRT